MGSSAVPGSVSASLAAGPLRRCCGASVPRVGAGGRGGAGLLVFDFTGPGWVMTQSRYPAALEAWVRALMPGQTGGGGGGVPGDLPGR